MGRKLYVGNLPYSITEQAVREAFGKCGKVDSVALITDRDTGQSKGFGFVEMSTDAEAQTAIQQMNGTSLDGRQIKVNEAKPKAPGGIDVFRFAVAAWKLPAGEKIKEDPRQARNRLMNQGGTDKKIELVMPPNMKDDDLKNVTEEDMVEFLKSQFSAFQEQTKELSSAFQKSTTGKA